MSKPAYKRVLLKLSGEALMGDDPYGINRATIERMVADVKRVMHGVVDLMATHEAVSWWMLVKMVMRGLVRRVKDSRAAGFFRGARVCVHAHEPGGAPVPIQIDGDFAGHLPYSAEIVPHGLTLFATR